MSEPKLSPGSGGIRHIPNPVQRRKELGVTDREQINCCLNGAISYGLGVLRRFLNSGVCDEL